MISYWNAHGFDDSNQENDYVDSTYFSLFLMQIVGNLPNSLGFIVSTSSIPLGIFSLWAKFNNFKSSSINLD